MNKYWELLPGNENLKEPKYTNLDYIKHLVPNVKIIVIFRDPVTRYVSYMIIMIGVKLVKSVFVMQNVYQSLFKNMVHVRFTRILWEPTDLISK